MRVVPIFLASIGLLSVLLASLLFLHPRMEAEPYARRAELRREMVAGYGLTDLCLFTEARYTRHPTQADLFAPFQNYPGAMDAFPSGSFIAPPQHIRSTGHARP